MRCFLSGDGAEGGDSQQAQGAHDAPGQQHAAHAGQHAAAEVHIQQAGGQGAGPGPRAGQGDAHKQQQRPEQAPACLGLELFAALFALFQAEGEEFADDGLVPAPLQHLPGKEIDQRHRQHIAHNGDDIRQPQGQAEAHAVGDGPPQLDDGHHGHQKHDETMLEHKGSFCSVKPV